MRLCRRHGCRCHRGDMVVGIQANRIKINEEPDSLLVNVDYSLDINYEHLSDCSIRLDVQSCPQ